MMLLAVGPLALHAEETAAIAQPLEEAIRTGGSKSLRFVLTSDETVIGRIVRIDEDSLLIRRPSAGLLSLPLTDIAAVKIKSSDGKLVPGQLQRLADGGIGWLADSDLTAGTEIAGLETDAQPDKGGPLIRLDTDVDSLDDASIERGPAGEDIDIETAEVKLTKLEEPGAPAPGAAPGPASTAIRLAVTADEASEGDRLIYFRLTLAEPAPQAILIIYTMINGSAVAPGDYTHRQGVVVFEPGQTEVAVATSIIDDDAAEGTESFTFFVTGDPANVVIDERKVTAKIEDDDG